MKSILFSGIGAGLGSAVYQVTAHGVSELDWYRSLFVCLFTMLFLGFFSYFKRPSKNQEET
ncbi:hypothetical protein SAMN05660691_04126 [Rheinheimera pacifica]|uniref:Uncharacterized protein n=1 Tax=Rheinheimera pacifica TaxID=173990 RepID=A0A1H6NF05_9GAMM|nr:hypothetical protein [Rheinheimera pacifica]SEI13795.1 hypothetical protein SAMN05660691_04126 [Rheinheimera pacifica]